MEEWNMDGKTKQTLERGEMEIISLTRKSWQKILLGYSIAYFLCVIEIYLYYRIVHNIARTHIIENIARIRMIEHYVSSDPIAWMYFVLMIGSQVALCFLIGYFLGKLNLSWKVIAVQIVFFVSFVYVIDHFEQLWPMSIRNLNLVDRILMLSPWLVLLNLFTLMHRSYQENQKAIILGLFILCAGPIYFMLLFTGLASWVG